MIRLEVALICANYADRLILVDLNSKDLIESDCSSPEDFRMSTETSIPIALKEKPASELAPKRSAVETIKEGSRLLRGGIREELAAENDHFNDQDKQLLKFHGTYQQEDRDARKARRKEGVGKYYMFMVRCKIPGGKLTAQQYLAMDELAGSYANGTLRFTTRQGIQLHGVLKDHLKDTIAGINACLLTTLGACGDVERNVMACPAPHGDHGVHAQLQETAAILAAHLAPQTRAYHEIWLNGEKIEDADNSSRADLEPLYGKTYLPRKFKTGLALPEDNCIDVYAQDLGLVAVVENCDIVGYNVLVGGGMGMTHGNANTFPHLAKPICYVPARAVVGVAGAVVKLFRDHGNRADRKRARIKYLVHDWGVDKFRQVLADYVGGMLMPARPIEVRGFETHLGWQAQGNGKFYYGLSIENGRVKDEGTLRLRSGLRAIIQRVQPSLRLTPLQDILLCDLDSAAKDEIERMLVEYGILRPDQISAVQRYSMACPAIPTCGLALTESERALPGFIDQFEAELERLGLGEEKLSVRMTGCPNGCARPYQSDIGLVGRSGDKYTVFVGGNVLGTRLNFMLKDLVPFAELMPTLQPLLEHFKQQRSPGESFGDYCHRMGAEKLREYLPRGAQATASGPHAGAATLKAANGNGDAHAAEKRRGSGNGKQLHGDSASVAIVGVRASPLIQVDREKLAGSPALPQPQTTSVTMAMSEPGVTSIPVAATRQSETFLEGRAGEEKPDFTYRFRDDGSVCETAVYFYGDDERARTATGNDPLRREAVYLGKVNAFRLHTAGKLSDVYYAGPPGHERRDRCVDYHANKVVARTVIFYYGGDVRAADAPAGAAIRRQEVYEE
jgi:sulfite reductase (ferredoxin)